MQKYKKYKKKQIVPKISLRGIYSSSLLPQTKHGVQRCIDLDTTSMFQLMKDHSFLKSKKVPTHSEQQLEKYNKDKNTWEIASFHGSIIYRMDPQVKMLPVTKIEKSKQTWLTIMNTSLFKPIIYGKQNPNTETDPKKFFFADHISTDGFTVNVLFKNVIPKKEIKKVRINGGKRKAASRSKRINTKRKRKNMKRKFSNKKINQWHTKNELNKVTAK